MFVTIKLGFLLISSSVIFCFLNQFYFESRPILLFLKLDFLDDLFSLSEGNHQGEYGILTDESGYKVHVDPKLMHVQSRMNMTDSCINIS